MAAQDEGLLRLAGERRPGVAGRVEVMLYRQLGQLVLKPGARLEPGGGPGNPLCSVVIGSERAKLLQVGNGFARVYWHVAPGLQVSFL
jgi:hypothetical protein